MFMRINQAVVFQQDGLDREAVVEEMNAKYGFVFDVEDDVLDDDTPITIVYISSTLAQSMRLKLDYHCVADKENRYILFPTA